MKVVNLFFALSLLVARALSAQQSFAELSAAASSAREANDLPHAVVLYQQALLLNPKWEEGWWSLGSTLYDMNRYPEAITALTEFTDLSPQAATGIGLRGLCEFETGAYTTSLNHLAHSLQIGLPPGQDQMEGVLRYHEALLLAHNGEFDAALRKYAWFVSKGVHHSVMLTSLGLAALHNPTFPDAIPESDLAVFIAAGSASYLSMTGSAQALQAFRDLAEKYSTTPFVHFLYGQILIPVDATAAISEMRKELEITHNSGEVCATLAWLLMEDDDFPEATPLAARAFHLAPNFPLSAYVYGRALVEKADFKEGINHLQIAVKSAPENLVFHIALAAAYAKAGRPVEARRERSVSLQLAHEEIATSRR
jgi:tetratricopeptide (TPR) repeat protein